MENKKILIVDDEPNILKLFSFILEKVEYAVDTALNGKEALKKLKENYSPVILLDIMMPEMGGLELLDILKKEYPDIQVIMVTATSSIDTAEQAVENGAFAYLSKPVKRNEVITTVGHAFEKYKSLKEKPQPEVEGEPKTTIYTLIIADYEGKIRKINKVTEKMLEYREGELTGESVRNIFGADYTFGNQFQEIPEKLKVENFEMNFITKNKEERIYLFYGTIMNDVERNILGFVGMLKKKEFAA